MDTNVVSLERNSRNKEFIWLNTKIALNVFCFFGGGVALHSGKEGVCETVLKCLELVSSSRITRPRRPPRPRRPREWDTGASAGIRPATSPASAWWAGDVCVCCSSAAPPASHRPSRSSPATPWADAPAAPHCPSETHTNTRHPSVLATLAPSTWFMQTWGYRIK